MGDASGSQEVPEPIRDSGMPRGPSFISIECCISICARSGHVAQAMSASKSLRMSEILSSQSRKRAPHGRRGHTTPGTPDLGLRGWSERRSEVGNQRRGRPGSGPARRDLRHDREVDPRRRGGAARRAGAAHCAGQARGIDMTGAMSRWCGGEGRYAGVTGPVHPWHVHRARRRSLGKKRDAHRHGTALRRRGKSKGGSERSDERGMPMTGLHVVNIPRSSRASRAPRAGRSAPRRQWMPT